MNTSRKVKVGKVNLFFYRKFNVTMPIISKLKNLMNLVRCQKQLECQQHILHKLRLYSLIETPFIMA